ncbi:helix-turn-helix domain-containing protein, partial [Escherichia coli]
MSRLLGERKLKISDVVRDTGINRGTLTRLY